mmetsp:Transcript_36378/g.86382  ORF Transcript_36378/g.86382 Transcript_36378/m.86382 type:complete len:376 (+) Transcript_36378:505-1632(+)
MITVTEGWHGNTTLCKEARGETGLSPTASCGCRRWAEFGQGGANRVERTTPPAALCVGVGWEGRGPEEGAPFRRGGGGHGGYRQIRHAPGSSCWGSLPGGVRRSAQSSRRAKQKAAAPHVHGGGGGAVPSHPAPGEGVWEGEARPREGGRASAVGGRRRAGERLLQVAPDGGDVGVLLAMSALEDLERAAQQRLGGGGVAGGGEGVPDRGGELGAAVGRGGGAPEDVGDDAADAAHHGAGAGAVALVLPAGPADVRQHRLPLRRALKGGVGDPRAGDRPREGRAVPDVEQVGEHLDAAVARGGRGADLEKAPRVAEAGARGVDDHERALRALGLLPRGGEVGLGVPGGEAEREEAEPHDGALAELKPPPQAVDHL